jgi:hypothetical protein
MTGAGPFGRANVLSNAARGFFPDGPSFAARKTAVAPTDDSGPVSVVHGPVTIDAHRAVREARDMYRRVMMGWASDALVIRQRGLDSIRWQAHDDEQTWSKAA